jgi:hypothetical protein
MLRGFIKIFRSYLIISSIILRSRIKWTTIRNEKVNIDQTNKLRNKKFPEWYKAVLVMQMLSAALLCMLPFSFFFLGREREREREREC